MVLISAAEGERRDLYGAVGYSATTATSTPRSRSGARCQGWLAHIHSGGGIVAGRLSAEFEETEHKAAALRRAFELAAGIPEATPPAPVGAEP